MTFCLKNFSICPKNSIELIAKKICEFDACHTIWAQRPAVNMAKNTQSPRVTAQNLATIVNENLYAQIVWQTSNLQFFSDQFYGVLRTYTEVFETKCPLVFSLGCFIDLSKNLSMLMVGWTCTYQGVRHDTQHDRYNYWIN